MFKNTAIFLAERACPSISYRIKKEILDEDISKPNMQLLQTNILNEDEILRVFSLKKVDGWLGGWCQVYTIFVCLHIQILGKIIKTKRC